MGLKYLIPLSLLFLAGCATTGTGTAPRAEEAPVVAAEPANVPSSTATIDEHLYEPPTAEATLVDSVDTHVHESPWVMVLPLIVLAAGAEIVIEIKDEDYGGRDYSCRDPEGHVWNFGSYDPWAAT